MINLLISAKAVYEADDVYDMSEPALDRFSAAYDMCSGLYCYDDMLAMVTDISDNDAFDFIYTMELETSTAADYERIADSVRSRRPGLAEQIDDLVESARDYEENREEYLAIVND